MASEATVRATIKTIVESVADIGLVYNRRRWATDTTRFMTLFKTDINGVDLIRGWQIYCDFWTAERVTFQGNIREYNYIIHGYMVVDDDNESELEAIALAESIIEALNSATTLNVKPLFPRSNDLAQLEAFDHIIFGNVLCHDIVINQKVFALESTG